MKLNKDIVIRNFQLHVMDIVEVDRIYKGLWLKLNNLLSDVECKKVKFHDRYYYRYESKKNPNIYFQINNEYNFIRFSNLLTFKHNYIIDVNDWKEILKYLINYLQLDNEPDISTYTH